jgi:serine/threonine protein kinase
VSISLADYELVERIGEGGSAEVWRARDRALGAEVAIKLLHSEDAVSELMRSRFELEARAAASLQSPHAVAILDFGAAEDGTLFLVMELLHGIDLQRLVKQFGPQEPSRTIHLLAQVCDVLHEAHGQNMVHRDIKPANVFITHDHESGDFVEVVDFGLVRAIGCDRKEPTTPQNMSGTVAFMPPEVVTAECVGECDVDGRADLYALGCVAFRLLTGERPFDAKTAIAMAAAHAMSEPPSPAARAKQPIPRALDQCVLDCLAKDPTDRPQSATALAERLLALPAADEWTPRRAEAWWAENLPEVAEREHDTGHS